MAKSREKVNKQAGFWDPEVSSPDHDTVMRWAYENADMILRKLYPKSFDRPWSREELDLGHDRASDTDERLEAARAFAKENARPNPRVTEKTIEYVLKRYTGYQERTEMIVGYADLIIDTEIASLVARYKRGETQHADDFFSGFEIRWSTWLPRGKGNGNDARAPRIAIEAKSVMPTLGELIRQINLYRTAFGGKFVVVSPDDRFADILAEQGVTFIKYEP